MAGDNLSVGDGGERKDLLSGAAIDLLARYTDDKGPDQTVDIVSNGVFASDASSSGFGDFLAAYPNIGKNGLYVEDNPPLPIPRLDIDNTDDLVQILNKKPQKLDLIYILYLNDDLGLAADGGGDSIIPKIPQPELLLELPMRFRIENDDSGAAKLDLTPFLEEYLPDWQDMLDWEKDGRSLKESLEDMGFTSLSAEVTINAAYINTLGLNNAEVYVSLWEDSGVSEPDKLRLAPRRLLIQDDTGGGVKTTSFSFDITKEDLAKNYKARLELQAPGVPGEHYGLLTVNRGGIFNLQRISVAVAADFTIEADLPWSGK
jgi:hypothetical protein